MTERCTDHGFPIAENPFDAPTIMKAIGLAGDPYPACRASSRITSSHAPTVQIDAAAQPARMSDG